MALPVIDEMAGFPDCGRDCQTWRAADAFRLGCIRCDVVGLDQAIMWLVTRHGGNLAPLVSLLNHWEGRIRYLVEKQEAEDAG